MACDADSCCGQRKEIPSGVHPQEEESDIPSCCKDKPSPCCDVSCLDRIALRGCNQGRTPSTSEGGSSSKFTSTRDFSPGCINTRSSEPWLSKSQWNPAAHRQHAPPLLKSVALSTRPGLFALRSALAAQRLVGSQGDTAALVEGVKERRAPAAVAVLWSVLKSLSSVLRLARKLPTLKAAAVRRKLISLSKQHASVTKSDISDTAACSKGCCGSLERPKAARQCAPTGKDAKSGGCCSPEKSGLVKPHSPATKSEASDTKTCSKGCCGKPNVDQAPNDGQSSLKKINSGHCGSIDSSCAPKAAPCASAEEKRDNLDTCSTGCCSKAEESSDALTRPKRDSCSAGCCGKPVPSKDKSSDLIEVVPVSPSPDLEKGLSGKEHVVLSISGMTCTGCETKLQRTLGTLQSVQNLKTSLVLSRAEFDLDVRIQSVDQVFKHLEKTTEFKYERITDRGSRVDVIVSNATEFMKQDWPRGVTEMTPVDNETVTVAFDAKVTGARDLVERGWDRPLSLATRPDPTLHAGSKHVRHMGWMTILSIILTVPVLVLAWAPLPERKITYGSVSLALATIVQVVIAGPFYPKAVKALVFSRIIEMDLLIVLSTSAAYIFSVVSFGYLVTGQPLSTGEFFETSTLLVTLIMVGRYVAALARQKAVESISVRSLQTPTAILVDDSGTDEKEIDVRLLQYGDVFKVLPDSRIPTDGTVIAGSSEVNESMITGESIPVDKTPGSAVIAGSVNGSGVLVVRLTRLPVDNTVSVIAGMVDQAKLSKVKIQDIADRVASYFVPVVVALTIITFVIWIAVGIAVRNQSGSRATTEAITYAITVLIVSCPCAIGLAVPMVIVIASGVAAERGVVFKAADSIEVAYKASHVVFDKTGTMTQGKLTVAVEHIDTTRNSMSLLLGLIGSNKHPISAAVAAHLKAKGISASIVTDAKVLTGKGLESSASGYILRAGNSRWLNLSSNPQVQSVLEQGYTAFCFTVNDTLAAVFGLEDSLRPDAIDAVTKLQERRIAVHLLSGDDEGSVHATARQLGIAAQNVRSRCTPADKQAYIQALMTPAQQPVHTKSPTTIFVGDGTNDAVALATATIGVHMNEDTGSDVAKSAADVVLMRPSVRGILTMISISEKAVRRIKFNFGWSFVYNLFAVLLGAGAFVNARIPPEYAGLGELVSVLPVIFAAVLLRWAKV
ncbi:hypothetical protein ATEG_02507 [Aspergillus terreus NIH2624]|uniref:HMA domain-containing protein n=1 Tax=Aspergillus terreus (strain NIH 2624 / FGSC A1156) TaxID=341663 RepID=Q0CUX7_ASPTN|nr:uncharacterized protein ATEG_02507 [Aspergillus terreus NIH2624]EAU37469.1 hypothetical protein ATEG_02507 [Aspergillus terreus NIH2624]